MKLLIHENEEPKIFARKVDTAPTIAPKQQYFNSISGKMKK